MKTFHMVEEHSRALDLDKITSKLMLSPGSKNNINRRKLEQHSSGTTEKKKTIEMQPNQQGKKEEVKAYNPPVPFPQRLQKVKLEE